MIFNIKRYLGFIFFCIVVIQSSCGVYSFTGASVSPDTKTVKVSLIENNSGFAAPTLSQTFTESLKQKILNSTSLNITTADADLDFSGSITSINITPIGIQGNQQSAQNRFEVSVNINFVNSKDEKLSFEKVFKRNVDFAADRSIDQVQSALLEQITKELVQDIFNAAFTNW